MRKLICDFCSKTEEEDKEFHSIPNLIKLNEFMGRTSPYEFFDSCSLCYKKFMIAYNMIIRELKQDSYPRVPPSMTSL